MVIQNEQEYLGLINFRKKLIETEHWYAIGYRFEEKLAVIDKAISEYESERKEFFNATRL